MSATEFSLLSPEVMSTVGLPLSNTSVAIATDEAGDVVSIASFNTAYRRQMCNSCTNSCATGGIVWTRRDYRSQGVFGALFSWAVEQLGIDPLYSHDSSTTGQLVAQRRGLRVPQNLADLPPVGNLYEQELVINELAISIKEAM